VSLVDSPRLVGRFEMASHPLVQFRCITQTQAHHGGMASIQTALLQEFLDIPVGQRVPKIPPDRTENDRRLGLSPFENCWSDGHFRSPSRLSASIQKVATHPLLRSWRVSKCHYG